MYTINEITCLVSLLHGLLLQIALRTGCFFSPASLQTRAGAESPAFMLHGQCFSVVLGHAEIYSLNNDPARVNFLPGCTMYGCDTRVVYSNPTWGTDPLLGFFLCDNLDRWRPCEPADPLSKDFYPMAVKRFRYQENRRTLAALYCDSEWKGACHLFIIFIIIIWHYNPLWVFAFSAKSLQVLLSLAVSFQFLTFSFFRSSMTSLAIVVLVFIVAGSHRFPI